MEVVPKHNERRFGGQKGEQVREREMNKMKKRRGEENESWNDETDTKSYEI